MKIIVLNNTQKIKNLFELLSIKDQDLLTEYEILLSYDHKKQQAVMLTKDYEQAGKWRQKEISGIKKIIRLLNEKGIFKDNDKIIHISEPE